MPRSAHLKRKAGDLLFVIDPRPFEATLRQAQANVARDTAQLRQAEAALGQREAGVQQAQATVERDLAQLENARTQEQRYRDLLQQELIAREHYDQLRTNMTALEATVQADRAAIEHSKAALAAARATIENARAVARLRFRPILMTSFAFILGSLPLVVASGAGAASRHSIDTTVVGGMLAVTVLGVLLVPAFYVVVEGLAERRRRPDR